MPTFEPKLHRNTHLPAPFDFEVRKNGAAQWVRASESGHQQHISGGIMRSAADIAAFVDIETYPLLREGTGAWIKCVQRIRYELAAVDCAVLPGFIRVHQLADLATEGQAIAPLAWSHVEVVNAYNIALGPELPDWHPCWIQLERGNAFVARDQIPSRFLISQLFHNPAFQRFVAACFGMERVYELEDPLSGLCLNVLKPGREHPWHFDTNEFTVSLLTQQPASGGVFEFCPNIRSPKNENFSAVRDVLEGRDEQVQRLVLETGDLLLFRGRYSLHRVTPVVGDVERHSAILAYTKQPGVIGSPERTRQLFGRVLPAHLAAAERRRADSLLD
jgi:hypothetical protein